MTRKQELIRLLLFLLIALALVLVYSWFFQAVGW